MREYRFGCALFLAAMIFASQSVAQTGGTQTRADSRRTGVRQQQEPAPPRIGPASPAFESERYCTYRGGPKTGFWSCQ